MLAHFSFADLALLEVFVIAIRFHDIGDRDLEALSLAKRRKLHE